MKINHPNLLRNTARTIRDPQARAARTPDQWETLATTLEQAARHIEQADQQVADLTPPVRLSDIPTLDATPTPKKQAKRLHHELPKIKKNAKYILRTVNRWIYMGFVTSTYPHDTRNPLELSPAAQNALQEDARYRQEMEEHLNAVFGPKPTHDDEQDNQ